MQRRFRTRILYTDGKALWLKNINMPIGVATYQLRNTLPEEMKEMLPEPEEIVKRLKVFEKL